MWVLMAAVAGALVLVGSAAAEPIALRPEIGLKRVLTVPRQTMRIAVDRATGILYTMTIRGEISRVYLPSPQDSGAASLARAEVVHTSADHGLSDVQGLDIGPDGTFFLAANGGGTDARTIAVVSGRPDGAGGRAWTRLAETEPIPLGTKNHPHPGIVLSPDGRHLFINTGSRTDHGELAESGGKYPGAREVPLSSAILRVPTDGQGLVIPADGDALRASGFLFADGHRNAFDMAFAGNGDLFAIDNGPDNDMADEINWIRQGLHYGFPWRMGAMDNPQRDPAYDPATDNLLLVDSEARRNGWYHNDPGFPPAPGPFTDPVLSFGPDADHYRDPATGQIRDASDDGVTIYTMTPHSSPVGLVFDVDGGLGPPYSGGAFVLRTGGDCCDLILPFDDPDEDLLHLYLRKEGDHYVTQVHRLVSGFRGPIDAVLVENRIYVIEWSGSRGLWEVAFPAGPTTAVLEDAERPPAHFALQPSYPNPFNGNAVLPYRVDAAASVELSIYDSAGQRVRRLVEGYHTRGSYAASWDGRDDDGAPAASGVYYYHLRSGTQSQARRLTLLR